MIPEWKPIPGYEERYSVSSAGQIRSNRTNKVIKQRKHKGRCMIYFRKGSV